MQEEQKPKILVVDDDKRVLKSLKLWFSSEGLHPLVAVNGNEALKMVIDHEVDVAVVDFRIGKEDGVSIAKQLKEVDEELKVVADIQHSLLPRSLPHGAPASAAAHPCNTTGRAGRWLIS